VNQISRIGMDTSKHIFQLHGVDDVEMQVLRRKLWRKDMIAFFEKLAQTRIAIEACGAEGDLAGERTGGVIDRSPTRVNP
jgi:transposase